MKIADTVYLLSDAKETEVTKVSAGAITRDELITIRIEEECIGCEEIHDPFHPVDPPSWRPAQICPVHGEHSYRFWDQLNDELRRRFQS